MTPNDLVRLARQELAVARRLEPRNPRLPHVERLASYPQVPSLSTD